MSKTESCNRISDNETEWRDKYRRLVKIRDRLNNSDVSITHHDGEIGVENADTQPFKSLVKSIADQFGVDNVSVVLAQRVRASLASDPRYSRENREWAEKQPCFYRCFDMEEIESVAYVNTHPCILNDFISELRKIS